MRGIFPGDGALNEFTLIRKNMFRKRLRAVLLTFSIAVAFFILGLLAAFYKVWTVGMDAAPAERLITVNRLNFTVDMPLAYFNRVQAIDGIRNSTHASWVEGYYQDPRQYVLALAVEPASYLAAYSELTLPEEARTAFLQNRTCLLAGDQLASLYGWNVGDRVPIMSDTWQAVDRVTSWNLDVCGIFNADEGSFPANYALFHYAYYNENLAFNRDRIGWIIINTADSDRNIEVAREIDTLFENSSIATSTTPENTFNEAFQDQYGNIALVLLWVVGASLLTILMIVGTTMVMAVRERQTEIAVLKTIGFPAARIFRMLLGESILLSLSGGVIGLAAATALLGLLEAEVGDVLPISSISWDVAMIGFALMLALGLVTGLWPATSAHKLRIVDALGKQ